MENELKLELYNLKQLYADREREMSIALRGVKELADQKNPAAFTALDSAVRAVNQLYIISKKYQSVLERR